MRCICRISLTVLMLFPLGISGCAFLTGDLPAPKDAISPIRRLTGHTYFVTSLAFSPDGKWLASVSEDKSLRLWDVASGKQIQKWDSGQDVRGILFLHDGRHVVTTGNILTSAPVYDLDTGTITAEYHPSAVHHEIALSADGHTIAFAGEERCALDLFDVDTGKPWPNIEDDRLPPWPPVNLRSIAFSPDGKQIAGAGDDKHIRFWSLESRKIVDEILCEDWPETIAYSPDGRFLIVGGQDTCNVFNRATKQKFMVIPKSARLNWTALFTPDSRTIVCGEGFRQEVWTVGGGRIATLFDQNCYASCIAISPDGRWVAAGGGVGSYGLGTYPAGGFEICIWEMPAPRP